MPWWRAIATGPWFIVLLNLRGFQMSRAGLALAFVCATLLEGGPALRWFVASMLVGECLTGFFAVWTVHHDCDPHADLARTQRGWLKNLISYDMFFHLEHHLFPAVPTPRLPELAAPLDEAVPNLRTKGVF